MKRYRVPLGAGYIPKGQYRTREEKRRAGFILPFDEGINGKTKMRSPSDFSSLAFCLSLGRESYTQCYGAVAGCWSTSTVAVGSLGPQNMPSVYERVLYHNIKNLI